MNEAYVDFQTQTPMDLDPHLPTTHILQGFGVKTQTQKIQSLFFFELELRMEISRKYGFCRRYEELEPSEILICSLSKIFSIYMMNLLHLTLCAEVRERVHIGLSDAVCFLKLFYIVRICFDFSY